MERDNDPNDLPEHNIPLGREIYLTPEQIAIRGLVDKLYEWLDHPRRRENSE